MNLKSILKLINIKKPDIKESDISDNIKKSEDNIKTINKKKKEIIYKILNPDEYYDHMHEDEYDIIPD